LRLSAYDARSHRHWHQQLVHHFPQHQWQVLTLKDRHFAWRMGGNAISFQAQYDTLLQGSYDHLLATSMTDLSTLRGLYPHLGQIPNTVYFHENQFAYPINRRQQGLQGMQLRSVYAGLAADQLLFNSRFNRDTYCQGAQSLCEQMPDGIPPHLAAQLRNKSAVLPVPLATDCAVKPSTNESINDPLEVVWNHRWEHDKGPDTLLALMRLCQQQAASDRTIRFHLLGQQFRQQPAAFDAIEQHHRDLCLHLGFVESRTDYLDILRQADVVLSTASHDFQGLAMLEAVACGCLPLAPDRVVYPELYPAENLYPSSPEDPKQEAQAIWSRLQRVEALQPAAVHCDWSQLHSAYAQALSHELVV